MAGAGSRFTRIGINKYKHEITANGKSLFEWSLLSLIDFFDAKFIFAVREECYNKQFIEKICNKIGIRLFEFIIINKLTKGQAETALYCDPSINTYEPIIIYNIDTYVEPEFIKKNNISNKYDGYIPVFKAEDSRLSFLQFDQKGNVIGIQEKEKISEYGTIGLYYFKTWELFKNVYKATYAFDYIEEQYIAPLYNQLLKCNMHIGYDIINEKCVHVLGTPEDIVKFDKNYLNYNL